MTPSMKSFLAWIAVLAIVDLGYSLGWPGCLAGGSISLEAARLYKVYPWSRVAFLAVGLLLLLILDWHFATYGHKSGGR